MRVCEEGWEKLGTLGGFVTATYAAGRRTLYGTSAGHVLSQLGKPSKLKSDLVGQCSILQETDWQAEFDIEDSREEESSSEGEDVWPERHEEDIDESLEPKGNQILSEDNGPFELLPVNWSKIGDVCMSSATYEKSTGSLDWGLIKLVDLSHPNLKLSDAKTLRQPLIPVSRSTPLHRDKMLDVFCGVSGHKKGRLTETMSTLFLAPGAQVVRTYNLRLSDGTGMR